ncbi:MAG TPA: 1-deoxy-D-xylulose-5-phosphate reductoisomerase [Deltaproteobacteria bacterium]|nr:MAG: 1-deoxy-D-xylulose-5-phosphate reductoisomerase [Deltaproteobacteria bacterium GWA2_65_63]OGP28736.1 MAG: 1-deoxy-D-xylulose-5-phosphate reductoisomerase [Deltaproteobacteria bacterium GWB2_65_81]OGP37191.1 MAG: 1-deoxy-D-xylulose-5-phosphate reductoisomerase [Deltaproteobacteria bacterium GWC2_66_88]OGP78838.1 MAG: 1-deoxy-D-xylulose-5-phosphate reductoisomerase [Deltaproteobacteria bacterium RBG_16_66_15]HAM31972.1 1-deoxy-D-xylulose-5-phosphate reductoisomerase [Deltaproteobacteria b
MSRLGIAVLGATGSVGRNALDVISRFPRRFRAAALCAGSDIRGLAALARVFRPDVVCLYDGNRGRLPREFPRGTRLLFGEEGMREAACAGNVDIVLAAASGVSSIRPVLSAAREGKRIALANKELLVMAGKFVTAAARRGKGEILPVDSEHSAVFQAIVGHRREDVRRILLTASGGPFRTHTTARMRSATVAQALGHPTWRMGAKISVDSATLMNKGLEVIEATWLFGLPPARIEVVIHPQSVVHSMVEFSDGSVMAQMGIPDMRIPIGYALSYPERLPLELPRLRPHRMQGLVFERPDRKRFPALRLAYAAARTGGSAPAVLNGANEEAVRAFLAGRIAFTDIVRIVDRVLSGWSETFAARSLQDVLAADAQARREALDRISRQRRHRPS